MAGDDSVYRKAEKRIEWLTALLGTVAAILATVRWGWAAGIGLALGAALSWLNFRWLKQGVGALVAVAAAQTGSDKPRIPRAVYLKFFGRFGLLLVVVYVILSRSILPAAAVLAGLFALVAAVLLEMVMELARGTQGNQAHR
jgi:ATP synthase I chain